MIFERPFNQLMEDVWRKQLVDVGSGEVVCERLWGINIIR